jgi:hypothetical protein
MARRLLYLGLEREADTMDSENENPFEETKDVVEHVEDGAEVVETLSEGTEVAEFAADVSEACGPAGMVLGAGALGYEAGTYLDNKLGISDAISDETSGVNAVMKKNGLHDMKKGSAEDKQRLAIEANLRRAQAMQHYAH